MLILRSVLLFFLLVTLSAGEDKPGTGLDKPVTFGFAGTFLSDATDFLGEETGIRIQVDPVVNQRGHSLWLDAKGMSLRNALVWITELTGTVYTEKDGEIRINEQAGKTVVIGPDKEMAPAIKKSLGALVTVEFKQRALSDASAFFFDLSGLTIVISPRLQATDPMVKLKADGVTLSSILDQIAKSCGATWMVRNQAVFFDLAPGATKTAP